MNKRWIILMVIPCIIIALLVSACATSAPTPMPTPTPTPASKPISVEAKTLKFSYALVKGQSLARGWEWFAAEFGKRTEGRYKVETYPSASLVGLPAALDSVRSNVCQMQQAATTFFPKDFPLSLITSLPGLGVPMTTLEANLKAYAACQELYQKFPEIQAQYKNYKLVSYDPLDPNNLISKTKEIHTPSDLKGLRVGCSGHISEIVKSNGGAAVNQVPPMSYVNLDKGVTDAAIITFAQVSDYRLYEVANYYSTQNFGNGCVIILMNLETWKAMSPQDQKIFEDTWVEGRVKSIEGTKENATAGRKAWLDAGKKIIDPNPDEVRAWESNAEPAIKKWRDDCLAANIDSGTVDKVLEAWKNLREKLLK